MQLVYGYWNIDIVEDQFCKIILGASIDKSLVEVW